MSAAGGSGAMEVLRGYILEEFLPGEDPEGLTPTTPLMATGILDSIGMLKVIMFLEEEFGVHIDAQEADEKNLGTLAAICNLIESKTQR